MSSLREQVREFHEMYDQPIGDKPCIPPEDRVRLRLRLIAEEFFELLDASLTTNSLTTAAYDLVMSACNATYLSPDMVEIADALADLDYVIAGMRLEFGINGDPIANEVHRSNMSKLGLDGKPVKNEQGKVVKGPHYSPPDIASELRKQGWKP